MKQTKLARIFTLVARDAAAIFPYLLVFYLVSLFFSFFFPVWNSFLYWPALHEGIVLFALLSIVSEKGRIWTFLRQKVLFWKGELRTADYIKFTVIVAVLAYALFQNIDIFNFLLVLFGLVSVLFKLDMRIAAGCALAFLALTPVLLAFSMGALAEITAVYAYYFLVIAVVTEIHVIHSSQRGG